MSSNVSATPTSVPPGVPANLVTPQGNVPAVGIPNTQDYPRLVFTSPYFETVAIAEIIQPSVTEAVEAVLPSLVPPYVDNAVLTGIQQYAVLLTGSTMSGPLFLNPLMPTADSQAATKAYVDTMLATAGIPEVPPVPVGQIWGRETGQWTPINQAAGTFLPITGGSMQGNINMSGNTVTNMAAVPAMPNGAAPAQWVLNQIASVSLYQGTWDADTNTPDLTQLSTHVNAYTWIAITTSPSGVVIGPAIPGLQGQTVFNGDTIIYSTAQGAFSSIHAGGISLPEADGRYVQLAGSQMSGALLLNANATQPLQAATYGQLEAAVANTVTPDAPADGQGYLRVGVGTTRWVPGLPLAGGILTGALTLSGPGASGNNAVTVTQLNSAVSGVTAGLMPIAGGTFTGAVILNGNATVNLNPVPLQQVNSMLATYATTNFVNSTFLPLVGGTLTGPLTLAGTGSNLSVQGTGTQQIGGTAAAVNICGTTTSFNSGGIATVSGIFSAGVTINGTGTALNVANGGATFGASVIGHGQFISEVAGNGSAFSCYNTTANASCGIYGSGNGAQLIVASMNALGGPIANWQIHSGGGFLPAADNTQACGLPGGAWNEVASYSFAQQSDPRLKKDVAPAPAGALAHVQAIPVQNFHWNVEDSAAPLHIGWLATDIQAALGTGSATVSVGSDENETLSLNTSEMVAVLWQAVQELAARR